MRPQFADEARGDQRRAIRQWRNETWHDITYCTAVTITFFLTLSETPADASIQWLFFPNQSISFASYLSFLIIWESAEQKVVGVDFFPFSKSPVSKGRVLNESGICFIFFIPGTF